MTVEGTSLTMAPDAPLNTAKSPSVELPGPTTLPLPGPPVLHWGIRPVTSKPRYLPEHDAGSGSGPTVLPGCENSPRPVMSLFLSQISRCVAMMSVRSRLKLRVGTPVPSVYCEIRRGRLAPTICTLPVCTALTVSTALVIGRARVDSEPDGEVIVQPCEASLKS